MTLSESRLVAFYRGHGRDHLGRRLSDICAFDFEELEFHHDYIQWLFPLPEPSGANASAPLLTLDDIAAFTSDPALGRVLVQSLDVMLRFYGLERDVDGDSVTIRRGEGFDVRRREWLTFGNHNFLRISRILRALSLLGRRTVAVALLKCLDGIYAEEARTIGPTTMGYWRRAVV